jgi:hypothetical protein
MIFLFFYLHLVSLTFIGEGGGEAEIENYEWWIVKWAGFLCGGLATGASAVRSYTHGRYYRL